MEHMALVMILLGGLLLFQKFIVRGFLGRWKATGDSFGQGGQYDPDKTLSCAYHEWDIGPPVQSDWYNVDCFEAACVARCVGYMATPLLCKSCLSGHGCFVPQCDGGL